MGLLTMVFTSRQAVEKVMPEVEVNLQAMCIVAKEPFGSKDREFINAVIQNQLQTDDDAPIKDLVRAEIQKLARRIETLPAKGVKLSAYDFLVQLRDTFDPDVAPGQVPYGQVPHGPTVTALVAISDAHPKVTSQRQPAAKHAGATQGQDRKATAPEAQQGTIERKINDLHSILGQLVKEFRTFKTELDSRRQTQRKDRKSQPAGGAPKESRKGQPEDRSEQYAAKAASWKASKKTFNRGKSSDEEISAEEKEELVHCADKGRPVRGVEQRAYSSISLTDKVFKLYGPFIETRDKAMLDNEPDAEDSDPFADIPPLEYETDYELMAASATGGASQAAILESLRTTTHMMNRDLKEKLPFNFDTENLSTIYVDMTVWDALPKQ